MTRKNLFVVLAATLLLHAFTSNSWCCSAASVTSTTPDGEEDITTAENDLLSISDNQDEDEENDLRQQEMTLNWTRAFFQLARRPRKGSIQYYFNKQLVIGDETFGPRDAASTSPDSGETAREARKLKDNSASGRNSSDEHLLTELETEMFLSVIAKANLHNNTRVTALQKLLVNNSDTSYVFADVAREEAVQRGERLALAHAQSLLKANELHLTTMINTVFSSSRDYITNETIRSSAVSYMFQKFDQLGLVTGTQVFEPLEYDDLFGDYIPIGTNVVGILPGELWGTKHDEILVIGAHWDTFPNSTGMDDNGSGVAAVFEVARAMSEASCKPKHSVIFVAFDLEEVGCLGSIYFIRDFLIPHILVANGGAKLKGAFILDTIMNFNDTEFSQTLSREWERLLPHLQENLKEENFKGDFLAALYRKEVDAKLSSTLAYHWNDDYLLSKSEKKNTHTRHDDNRIPEIDSSLDIIKSTKRFTLKNVRLNLSAEIDTIDTLAHWVDVLRSDHARFWFHNLDYPDPFPAVLITDTGPYRGMMRECYHQACDNAQANEILRFGSVPFLAKTCQALIDTMVNLSQAQCLVAKPSVTVSVTVPTSDNQSVKPTSVTALLGTIVTLLQWIGLMF